MTFQLILKVVQPISLTMKMESGLYAGHQVPPRVALHRHSICSSGTQSPVSCATNARSMLVPMKAHALESSCSDCAFVWRHSDTMLHISVPKNTVQPQHFSNFATYFSSILHVFFPSVTSSTSFLSLNPRQHAYARINRRHVDPTQLR